MVQEITCMVLCLGNKVITELCYKLKGTILQKNYRKMTIKWSFLYNSIVKFHGKKYLEATNVKFHGKKCGRHKITVVHSNLCYNDS